MKPIEDIEPKDKDGEYHGYQEWYDYFGNMNIRVIIKHGKELGYEEWHRYDTTNYYIR